MSLYNWNESYSVNINEIDTQHKQLLNMINELHEAKRVGKAKDVIAPILDKLTNYTVIHFDKEEELMKKYSYPEFEKHKLAHNELVEKVQVLNDQLSKGGFMISIEISNFLREWLMNHILGMDKKYSKFFNEKGIV